MGFGQEIHEEAGLVAKLADAVPAGQRRGMQEDAAAALAQELLLSSGRLLGLSHEDRSADHSRVVFEVHEHLQARRLRGQVGRIK
jgi:hypothetical protein